MCPGAAGGKEWNAMAYSPLTRLVYVPVIENCAIFSNYGVEAKKRGLPPGPSGFRYLPNQAYGKVMAIRADTGERAWEVRTRTPMGAGMLATAGGLLFTGEAEGNFIATTWTAARNSGLFRWARGFAPARSHTNSTAVSISRSRPEWPEPSEAIRGQVRHG